MHSSHSPNRRADSSSRFFFTCEHCRQPVAGQAPGTRHRNHCPHCLWSLHVDRQSGDRMSECHGRMEPIGIAVRDDGEWSLLHRCQSCGMIRMNRIASDDHALVLMSLAVKPLGSPPFPLGQLSRMVSQWRHQPPVP